MLKSDNDISDYDILFFDNGLCMEGKQINSLLEGKYLWKSGDWGAYKIYNDTIKVKTINRGSMNAGIWAEEKWYKIKNKNELQILHIKRLDNFDFYNPSMNHNFDSIHFYPSEYKELDKVNINPNNNWLLNKKWFWQNKEDYKKWKKGQKER